MHYTKSQNLFVLEKILCVKSVLFGKFSDGLTKTDKLDAWKKNI